MTSIEAEAARAAAMRNGRNGHRPSARARIEAARAAIAAVETALGELYANPLIARLDHEGLGSELAEPDLAAVLQLVRSLESRGQLPQRDNGNGSPAARERA